MAETRGFQQVDSMLEASYTFGKHITQRLAIIYHKYTNTNLTFQRSFTSLLSVL